MAQIVTDYDLSLGSKEYENLATDVNNIRFYWIVTGGTAGQKVYLYPTISPSNVNYDKLQKGNKSPFEFEIEGNMRDSDRILSVGSSYLGLNILCDGCTGLLNVFTYED